MTDGPLGGCVGSNVGIFDGNKVEPVGAAVVVSNVGLAVGATVGTGDEVGAGVGSAVGDEVGGKHL